MVHAIGNSIGGGDSGGLFNVSKYDDCVISPIIVPRHSGKKM